MWITLNSFIWNIKTMKHKPSTKSDSYKCRIIRLFKMNRLYWKPLFFSLWMVKQIHRNRRWHVNMIMPFTRSKSYLTAEEWENNKKKEKAEEEEWNSGIRLTAARSARRSKGSCDWSERIRPYENTTVLQTDDHYFPSLSSPAASAATSTQQPMCTYSIKVTIVTLHSIAY